MARSVELLEDRLVVRLGGFTRLAALTEDFEIPYSAIQSVSAEPFEAAPWKVAGANVPFTDIREGHFRLGGDWYFLSFEDRQKTVTLGLEGFTLPLAFGTNPSYRTVVLGVDDPQATANAIASRCGLKVEGQ